MGNSFLLVLLGAIVINVVGFKLIYAWAARSDRRWAEEHRNDNSTGEGANG